MVEFEYLFFSFSHPPHNFVNRQTFLLSEYNLIF